MLLLGCVAGQISAVVAKLILAGMSGATIRPDVAVALVIGIPSAIGMLLIFASGRRWVTALGAFILALGPGWLSVLLLLQVVPS